MEESPTLLVANRNGDTYINIKINGDDIEVVNDVERAGYIVQFENSSADQYLIDYIHGQILLRHKSQKILPFEDIKTIRLIDII